MDIFKYPNIMSIKGVFLKTTKPLEQLIDEKKLVSNEPTLEPLPAKFTTLARWPVKTAIKCWTCGATGNERPKPIITAIDRNKQTKEVEQTTLGCFLHWPCAAFHIQHFLGNSAQHKTWLAGIYEEFEDKKCAEIVPCLPPWRMREYGGDLSRDEWMRLSQLGNDKFQSHMQEISDGKAPEVTYITRDIADPVSHDEADLHEPTL